jgi:hypothetical protein
MQYAHWWVGATLSVAGLFVASGCGGGLSSQDTSTAEAKVSGTVKLRGKTLDRGEIVFDPSNYKRKDAPARSAPIKKDGTYEITTFVGQNSVRLAGDAVQKEPMLSGAMQTIDVKPDDNKIDFDFPPK